MSKQTIIIKKQTIVITLIVIVISSLAIKKYNKLSTRLENIFIENEQLIEQGEDLKNKVKQLEYQNIEINKANNDKSRVKNLKKLMLDNLNSEDIEIYINKRMLKFHNNLFPLDRVFVFYRYSDTNSRFGKHYLEFRCSDDSSCIYGVDGYIVAFATPVKNKSIAEKIANEVNKL